MRSFSLQKNSLRIACAGLLFVALSGCASGPGANQRDPLEKMNRVVYTFNDKLDTSIAVPVAKAYRAVVPGFARLLIGNFFGNLGDANAIANDVLQGRVRQGTEDLMRFAMNTVFGLGGLLDFASTVGLPRHDQDFGLTLARWGVPSGPYLVLPLFGPSTIRDAAGLAVDLQMDPTGYLDPGVRAGLFGLNFLSTRAKYLDATNLLAIAALDKYSFTRDAFLGRRQFLVNQGKSEDMRQEDGRAVPDHELEEPPPSNVSSPTSAANVMTNVSSLSGGIALGASSGRLRVMPLFGQAH